MLPFVPPLKSPNRKDYLNNLIRLEIQLCPGAFNFSSRNCVVKHFQNIKAGRFKEPPRDSPANEMDYWPNDN